MINTYKFLPLALDTYDFGPISMAGEYVACFSVSNGSNATGAAFYEMSKITVENKTYYQALPDSFNVVEGDSGIVLGYEAGAPAAFQPGGFVDPAISNGFTLSGGACNF